MIVNLKQYAWKKENTQANEKQTSKKLNFKVYLQLRGLANFTPIEKS